MVNRRRCPVSCANLAAIRCTTSAGAPELKTRMSSAAAVPRPTRRRGGAHNAHRQTAILVAGPSSSASFARPPAAGQVMFRSRGPLQKILQLFGIMLQGAAAVPLNGRSFAQLRDRVLHACLAAIALLVLAGAADGWADNYPSRPIRIVVPTQAGAAQDIMARLLQPYLEKALGQPIIVENRSGASTMIGTDAVAKAAPDGYTLLIVPTTFTVNAASNTKLTFDLRARLQPITVLVKNRCCSRSTPRSCGTHAGRIRGAGEGRAGQAQYETLCASDAGRDPVAYVGRARRASLAAHSLSRRSAAALAVAAGESPARAALAARDIAGKSMPGWWRPLATGGSRRSEFQEPPTAAESGISCFEAVQWPRPLLTTAGTPKAIVAKPRMSR